MEFEKILATRSRRDGLAWFFFLWLPVLLAYRKHVTEPIWLDGYLLYLPEVSFLLPVGLLLLCSRRSTTSLCRLAAAFLLLLGWLMPFRLDFTENRGHRLVSLNIQSQSTDLSNAIAGIQKVKPDFIFLQEIWRRPELENIERLLSDYQVLGAASHDYKRRNFNDGTFLAVRQDWTVHETLLKEESTLAKVSRNGLPLVIVSVHAPRAQDFSPAGLKQTLKEQIDKGTELRDDLATFREPIVIAGDFNAPDSGPAFKILESRFHSAFHQAASGFGLSFPSRFPVARIDHALGTEQVTFTGYRTQDFGSDHLGLIVDFEVSP